MEIRAIYDDDLKCRITRSILENLSEWFEISESRENYIREAKNKNYFCAYENQMPIGFLYLNETSKDTTEIAAMGVLKSHQSNGIGRKLFEFAKEFAIKSGYSFLQVKTLKMGICERYDKTNKFYVSLGFKEFEIFKNIWGENNPCQIYVMAL